MSRVSSHTRRISPYLEGLLQVARIDHVQKVLASIWRLWQVRPMQDRTDQELLSMILRDQFARVADKDINELIRAGRSEVPLTDIGYDRLMAGIELGRRVAEPKTNYNTAITSTVTAIEFCKTHFQRLIASGLQEEFHAVTLNTKHRMIGSHRITVGTLDASLVHPREVFRPAIRDAASAVLLAHNHPSGDSTPSREDIAVTDRLTDAGKLIGINVIDHIILAADRCVSIREFN